MVEEVEHQRPRPAVQQQGREKGDRACWPPRLVSRIPADSAAGRGAIHSTRHGWFAQQNPAEASNSAQRPNSCPAGLIAHHAVRPVRLQESATESAPSPARPPLSDCPCHDFLPRRRLQPNRSYPCRAQTLLLRFLNPENPDPSDIRRICISHLPLLFTRAGLRSLHTRAGATISSCAIVRKCRTCPTLLAVNSERRQTLYHRRHV